MTKGKGGTYRRLEGYWEDGEMIETIYMDGNDAIPEEVETLKVQDFDYSQMDVLTDILYSMPNLKKLYLHNIGMKMGHEPIADHPGAPKRVVWEDIGPDFGPVLDTSFLSPLEQLETICFDGPYTPPSEPST